MRIRFLSNYDRVKNIMNILMTTSLKNKKNIVVEDITPQQINSENVAKNICHELGKHIVIKKGNK